MHFKKTLIELLFYTNKKIPEFTTQRFFCWLNKITVIPFSEKEEIKFSGLLYSKKIQPQFPVFVSSP